MKKTKKFPSIFTVLLEAYLRDFAGATYPDKTLTRRLNLLTTREAKRVKSLYKKMDNLQMMIEDAAIEVDDILSYRASKVNDKWP